MKPCLPPALLRIAVLILLLTTLFSTPANAEPGAPGFQRTAWLLRGANVVVRPGEVLVETDLLIEDGLIRAVGKSIEPPPGTEIVDLKGFTIYPGLIDAWSTDLLDSNFKVPIPEARPVDVNRYALASTSADNRTSLTPAFDVGLALGNTDEAIPKIAADGFTVVHLLPSGRVSSGQGTLLSVRKAPLREIRIVPHTGIAFRLFAPSESRTYPSTLMGATAYLRQAFADARHHAEHRRLFAAGAAEVSRPPEDPDWEILNAVAQGERPMFWQANSRDDVYRVGRFLRENEVAGRPILFEAAQAHLALDELERMQARVIVSLDFGEAPKVEAESNPAAFVAEIKPPVSVQEERRELWRDRVRGLSQMAERKLPFAVGSQGLKSRSEVRKALQTAVSEGLSADDALAAVTIHAAEILGVEDRLGSIEPGKFAHLVVTNGPLFETETKIREVYVDGVRQEVDLKLKPRDASESAPKNPLPQLAGTWNLVIESATAKTPATLVLQQDGKRLTGSFRSEEGDGRLRAGEIEGTKVRWEVAIGAGAREVVLKFRGELKDDKLTGTLIPPFGKETEWSGARQPTPEAGQNPVELTIETDPASAPKPEEAVADSRPVELRADRLRRTMPAGKPLLLTNATIMTGTGDVLTETSLLFRDGKIAAIGRDLTVDAETTVIDLAGKYVIPGIIDTHSHIMITGGVNEATQSIVPEVSIRDVIDTDDIPEYRALAGGVTTARILHGSANVIGGQDGVVKLKFGKPAEEHLLLDAPQGVKFALGENVKAREGRFPNTRLGVEAVLQRAFLEAIEYRRSWRDFELRKRAQPEGLLPPRRDDRLEALADILDHEKFIHSHCYRADEILMLLRVANDLGIRVWSLQHVLEGYKVAPEIVAHGASCSTFADWWAYKVEAFDAIPHNAALLHEAGANVVIKSDDAELIRHLYLEAAKSIRYGGMPEQAALQAITRNPARELGLDDRIGTIEVGKDADVAVFSGHPFNAFARCEMTIIEGDVYFQRSDAPTAMSPAGVERSQSPADFALPTDELRAMTLDIPRSADGRYAFINAYLVPVDAAPIPNGTLIVENGKIVALGTELEVPSGVPTYNLGGLHVYPGMIDAGTTLGLTEIGRVGETSDFEEIGRIQPDLRAGVAINPDSELIPVARAGGITTILAQSQQGLVCGQSSIIRLHGWTAPQMTVDLTFGMRVNWPGEANKERQLKELKEFLAEARLYDATRTQAESRGETSLVDPRYEAFRPYLAGTKPLLVEAHTRRQIVEAVEFCESEKLKLILTGGTDAWKVASHLAERKIPVIVGPVMRSPVEDYDPFDAPYANPGRLSEAGVPFCIRSNVASNSRNAPFEAAMAVAYGLPPEAGLRAVTLSSAEILGLADELGSLTAGKRATFLIADGSPLQQTSQIKWVFVDGEPCKPETRQTRFYEKYRERLKEIPKDAVATP